MNREQPFGGQGAGDGQPKVVTESTPKEKLQRHYSGLSSEQRALLSKCRLTFDSSPSGNKIEGTIEDGRAISVTYNFRKLDNAPTTKGRYRGEIDGKPISDIQAQELFEKYNRIAGFQGIAASLKGDKEAQEYLTEIGVNV